MLLSGMVVIWRLLHQIPHTDFGHSLANLVGGGQKVGIWVKKGVFWGVFWYPKKGQKRPKRLKKGPKKAQKGSKKGPKPCVGGLWEGL